MRGRVNDAGETVQPRAGDEARAAVSALVEVAGGRLLALARRLCGNMADAEDLVQEVFLTALRKWDGFRGESEPTTWLYTIAARACRRRSMGRGRVGGRTGGPRAVPLAELMPWSEDGMSRLGTDACDAAERSEAIERLRGEIVRLPEHLRLPLVLREVLALSVEDTAAALGLAEGTVKSRLHRARLELRRVMVERARRVPAPAPLYERAVCLDLLRAKLAAMDSPDERVRRAIPQAEVCARCRAVFRELDVVGEACASLAEGKMPARVYERIVRVISGAGSDHGVRRGRPPKGLTSRRGKSRS